MMFVLLLSVLLAHECTGHYYNKHFAIRNKSRAFTTRTTLPEIDKYRSALTLDMMEAEDMRQREIVAAFETDKTGQRVIASDCMSYAKPSTGKVARLLIELLKNLEGDEGLLLTDFVQALVNSKMLFETSTFDNEPDLDSLIKTPEMMLGEPHTTFPRILTMLWMIITDPNMTKKNGWCPVRKITKFLHQTRPVEVARRMRRLQPIIFRTRYIIEEFIQSVTPVNTYQSTGSVVAFRASVSSSTVPKRINTTISVTDGSVATAKAVLPRHHGSVTGEAITNVRIAISTATPELSTPKIGLLHYYDMPLSRCPSAHQTFYIHSESTDYDEHVTWMMKQNKLREEQNCINIKPSARDIVRRFYAIVPYLDRDHANAAFLHKYRSAVYSMSEGEDLLDREAAYYATIITPIVFLQQYKDAWCLLERFHRALRLYRLSHPTEKRLALKVLQNVRGVNSKVNGMLSDISGSPPQSKHYTTTAANDVDINDIHSKDVKYLKELIKGLG